MKSLSQGRAVATAVVLSALGAVSASAMCGTKPNQSPAAYQLAVQSFQGMQARQQARAARLSGEAPRASSTPSIAGLWHTVFLVDPNGGYFTAGPNVFDEGFDAWHQDGTETLNDISPPPTGNVCIGVWTQTGTNTYLLKHPTWGYDENNINVIGVGTFIEKITLDPSGNSYTGTVSLDAFDLSGAALFHFDGTVMAERIAADTQPFMATPPTGVPVTAVVKASSSSTSDKSVTLDGSGSTGAGALTYLYSVLPGGKVPAILQTANNPKATVQFVNGPGTYIVQLHVTDSVGNSATSDPVTLTYTGN
ncbi:MAG: hypothetical protein LAP38_02495 [Acidobacteriia bacterium]|nr:hypothetical protein [Terriglobia bacterium]